MNPFSEDNTIIIDVAIHGLIEEMEKYGYDTLYPHLTKENKYTDPSGNWEVDRCVIGALLGVGRMRLGPVGTVELVDNGDDHDDDSI